jgi:thiol-disulfide isomerase/thioredoxin
LIIVFAFGLTTLPLLGQETNQEINTQTEKTFSLEGVKTVSDVEKRYYEWYASLPNKRHARTEVFKNQIKTSEKILELAQNDAEKSKGYDLKLRSLSALAQTGDKEAQENLDKLTKELEADEKFRSIVYDFQFIDFLMQSKLKNKDDFEKFKKELKTWINKPYANHKLVIRLSLSHAKTYAKTIVKDDSDFLSKFVDELVDYVKSSENAVSEDVKKTALELLEKLTRTFQGVDLKLYGKKLDDKNFDWDSLRGKYVIIKFTATWCNPCKKEIPGLISAYEKYKDKGLEIVSVYIWERGDDTDKIVENVKKFAEDENISWLIVSETLTEKSGQPKQGDFYAISGVPTMLLIDKEGKIINTDARGEVIQKKLAELFPDEK